MAIPIATRPLVLMARCSTSTVTGSAGTPTSFNISSKCNNSRQIHSSNRGKRPYEQSTTTNTAKEQSAVTGKERRAIHSGNKLNNNSNTTPYNSNSPASVGRIDNYSTANTAVKERGNRETTMKVDGSHVSFRSVSGMTTFLFINR
eukprot:scaffold107_cov215-Alexandrium_tamarense.AAC.4